MPEKKIVTKPVEIKITYPKMGGVKSSVPKMENPPPRPKGKK